MNPLAPVRAMLTGAAVAEIFVAVVFARSLRGWPSVRLGLEAFGAGTLARRIEGGSKRQDPA